MNEMFKQVFERDFTYVEAFRRVVRKFPDKDAMIDPATDRVWTYRQLNEEACRFANALAAVGVGKEDLVTYQLPNCPEFVFSYLAPQKIGAVTSPANPGFAPGESVVCLNSSKPKIYLYDEKIGQVVGRVTIAKANHHASPDSMSAAFVNALGARNYLVNVWHPVHINDTTMSRMASGGAERVYATYIPPEDEALIASAAWRTVLDPRGGHVVIRVTDGGKRYNILRLSAENESMVVTACDRYSVSR